MITVKFFSSLRELVGIDEIKISIDTPISLEKVWHNAANTAQMPNNTLCAINMKYAKMRDLANDNDEVAFFPPVTGG